jgi:hypothetical protein
MRDLGYEEAARKAFKIARAAATHRDAVAMIIAAGLAEDAAEADSLICEGEY